MEEKMKIMMLLILVLFSYSMLSATIINVPADQPTIQAGINVSVEGDTVLVQPETYVENINFSGKLIIVASLFLTTQDTTYISQTVIDGNQNGSVVIFENGEDSTAILCGFTVQNGSTTGNGGGIYCGNATSPSLENLTISGNSTTGTGTKGGGIHCNNASPSLTNVMITGNSSDELYGDGGGISCANSSPFIENVTIKNNSAYYDGGGFWCDYNSAPILMNVIIENNSSLLGGGVYCYSTTMVLEGVDIIGNNAEKGGGIFCCGNSAPSLENVTIEGNTAILYGGGIYCDDNSSPTLENVDIVENLTTGGYTRGAGVYCLSSSPILLDVNIYGNHSTYLGGGIYCDLNSSPTLENVEITNNIADYRGGGMYISDDSQPNFEYVIIDNNIANNGGGGILCYNSSPNIHTIAITNNSSAWGSGIYCDNSSPNIEKITITGNTASQGGGGIYNQGTSCPSINNSILWNNTPEEINIASGYVTATYSDIEGGWAGTGNINSDPLFIDPTNYDYHLQWGSPCIDTGDPSSPLDPDGTISDMGAFYYDQGTSIDCDYLNIPNVVRLFQNYPNPFNPSTIISFSVTQNAKSGSDGFSFVTLEIYNLKGQKVKTLLRETCESGNHSIIWNGDDDSGKSVSSGIYLYKLDVGDYHKVRKMILLK